MVVFERSFTVRVPLKLVWDFHSDPVALTKITPKPIKVVIKACDYPVQAGSRVLMVLQFSWFAIQWNSVISEYVPFQHFTDTQIKAQGPFKSWKHTHNFEATAAGTVITDHVEYEMPYGFLGRLADRVGGRLFINAMFRARARATRTRLEDAP